MILRYEMFNESKDDFFQFLKDICVDFCDSLNMETITDTDKRFLSSNKSGWKTTLEISILSNPGGDGYYYSISISSQKRRFIGVSDICKRVENAGYKCNEIDVGNFEKLLIVDK